MRRLAGSGLALFVLTACGELGVLPQVADTGPMEAGPSVILDQGFTADAQDDPEDGGLSLDARTATVGPDASSDPDASTDPDGGPSDIGPSDVPVDRADVPPGPDIVVPGDGGSAPDAFVPADTGPSDGGVLAVSPSASTVTLGSTLALQLAAPAGSAPVWSVDGVAGGSATAGTIVALADPREAAFTAPRSATVPGTRVVQAAVGAAVGFSTISLSNPAPAVASISPTSVDAGAPTTTFTIRGSGFVPATVVRVDGVNVPTMVVDWTRVEATVSMPLLGLPGVRRVSVINAAPGGGEATTTFAVVFRRSETGPGQAGLPMLFDNATVSNDPARAPQITYPESGAVSPRDFPAPTVSWSQPAPSNTCRVRFENQVVQIDLYAADDPARPAYINTSTTPDRTIWSTITNTAFTDFDLTISVACAEVVSAAGGPPSIANGRIYMSTSVTYRVSASSAGGRIVYFSGLGEGVWRLDIGSANATGRPWIGAGPMFQLNTGTRCVGCHSFDASGRTMAFISNAVVWNLGTATIANRVPTLALDPGRGGIGNWTSIHPTEDLVLTVSLSSDLSLHDAVSGRVLQTVPTAPAGPMVSQPNWSPRGDRFAYVAGTNGINGVSDMAQGQIWTATASITGATVTFGTPSQLVTPAVAGGSAYYPAFSPDGTWVIFAQSPSGSSYNNRFGSIWLTRTDGTIAPVELARANRVTGMYNSWPRWSPSYGGGRYWVVFQSQRPYPPYVGTGPQQLWVTRIDTNLLPGDPSSPAIWLPGQEPFTGNLTAEWTISQ